MEKSDNTVCKPESNVVSEMELYAFFVKYTLILISQILPYIWLPLAYILVQHVIFSQPVFDRPWWLWG